MSVFISYSTSQEAAAITLAGHLEMHGIRAWYAARDVHPGSEWDESIDNALTRSAAVVLLFSTAADASRHVKREMLLADEYEKELFVVKADDTEPKKLKYLLARARNPINFVSPEATSLTGLVSALLSLGCDRQFGPLGLASTDTKRVVSALDGSFSAVDDSILLIGSADPITDFTARVKLSPNHDYSGLWPSRKELGDHIASGPWDPAVVEHLTSMLPADEADEISQWKLAITKLVRAAPAQNQPSTAILNPQLWWVESNFNRQLVSASRSPEPEPGPAQSSLEGLAPLHAHRLLKSLRAGIYSFDFPSSLYVEVAVVDEHNELLILAKDQRAGSDESHAGRRWTCSVEESARVSDVADGHLDLTALAINGLQRELGIPPDLVSELALYGVALNVRSLNTAVVGVALLRGGSVNEIAAKAKQAKLNDFRDGRAVPLVDAVRLIEDPPQEMAAGSWHATARLRILLALTHAGMSPSLSDIY